MERRFVAEEIVAAVGALVVGACVIGTTELVDDDDEDDDEEEDAGGVLFDMLAPIWYSALFCNPGDGEPVQLSPILLEMFASGVVDFNGLLGDSDGSVELFVLF